MFGGSLKKAKEYIDATLHGNEFQKMNLDVGYIIAALWEDKNKNKIIDVFGYEVIPDDWKRKNSGINFGIIKNGLWIPQGFLACEEMFILLGRESEYSRKTKNLKEFFDKPLSIDILKEAGVWHD
jgi:hypothetical protein